MARKRSRLSIPCYNEERTLTASIKQVLAIATANLKLEVVIVDDCSVPIRLTQTPTRASVSYRGGHGHPPATIWLSPNRCLSFSGCFPMRLPVVVTVKT